MGKLIWRTFSIEATGKRYTEDSYKELEQKLSDSEADWLKMRDIAEETQRKLDEAIEVIRFYGKSEHWKLNRNNHAPLFSKCEDDLGEKARDFLAKIEGKK